MGREQLAGFVFGRHEKGMMNGWRKGSKRGFRKIGV